MKETSDKSKAKVSNKSKNYILAKRTWSLSIHASQSVYRGWRLHQEGKPFFTFQSSLKRPFSVRDVEEVIAFFESPSTDGDGDINFQTLLKTKDGRYLHTCSYYNSERDSWDENHGGVSAAWNLRTLVLSLYPEEIQDLNIEHLLSQ